MTVVRLVVVPVDVEVRPLEVPLSFRQLAVLFSLSLENSCSRLGPTVRRDRRFLLGYGYVCLESVPCLASL